MLEPYNSGAPYSRRISWSCRDSRTESATSSKTQRQAITSQKVCSAFSPAIIQDMYAVNRSCTSDTSADFQTADEILDTGGRPLVGPYSH